MFPNSTPINPIDKSLEEPYYDTCQNMGVKNGKELLETATRLWQKSLDWSYPTENPFEWLLDQKTMIEKKQERDRWFNENIKDDHMRHLLHYGNTNQIYYQFMTDSFPEGFDKDFWMNMLVSGGVIVAPPQDSMKMKNQIELTAEKDMKVIRKEELLKEIFSQETSKEKQENELNKVHHEIFVDEAY